MKSIDELDHYELLEIARTAGPSEVDRAYRLAQQTYAEGSLALYSIFESLDAEAIRSHLDEAYRVLSDPERRESYDRECCFEAPGSSVAESGERTFPGASTSFAQSLDATISIAAGNGHAAFDEVVQELDAFDDGVSGDFDGMRLRKTRLFRGYEIEDISEVTKVSGAHLRNIEEEHFEDLPADVYVRGFVTAYAKTIGLDPTRVVPSYMTRVRASRDGERRGRFLARG